MKSAKKSLSQKIAIEYIEKKCGNGTWKNGDRLPPLRALAKMAGVGHTSMEQALKQLQQEKKVAIKKNAGIFVGNKIPEKDPENQKEKPVLKWQNLKDRLKKDIFTGQFGPSGVLPSSKELVQEYGVDFRTLKKAISFLVDIEGLLKPYKRNYRTAIAYHNSSIRTIYFILSESMSQLIAASDTRQLIVEFTKELEKECSIRNIHLVKKTWTEGMHININDNLVGCILWFTQDFNIICENITITLRRFNKPLVVFLIEHEEKNITDTLQTYFRSLSGVFVNETNSLFRAGVEMGRFIYNKGHKKICYLSHTVNHQTSDYLEGLKNAYEALSCAYAVVPMFHENLTDNEKKSLLTKSDYAFDQSIQSDIDLLLKEKDIVQSMNNSSHGSRLVIEIQETRFRLNHRAFMAPLFRKALTVSDATAWVCHNDFLACHGALEFLKAEKIKVPDQIGVVGCDNLTEASMHNLTTWHFDYSVVVRKMISLIMFPEHSKKTLCLKGTNVYQIDGMVIDRGSA